MVPLVDECEVRGPQPDGNGQQPLAAAQNDWLVHEDAVGDASRLRPVRAVGRRIFRDDRPDASAAVPMTGGLRPEQPHTPLWIVPEAGVECAHKTRRIDYQFGRRPGFAVVPAGDEHDVILRALAGVAAVPEHPEAAIRGPLYCGDSLELPIGVGVFGARRGDDARRFHRGIGMRFRTRGRIHKQQGEFRGERNPARIILPASIIDQIQLILLAELSRAGRITVPLQPNQV